MLILNLLACGQNSEEQVKTDILEAIENDGQIDDNEKVEITYFIYDNFENNSAQTQAYIRDLENIAKATVERDSDLSRYTKTYTNHSLFKDQTFVTKVENAIQDHSEN